MAETFTPYDAADYLRTDEDAAEYLKATAEEGDAAAILKALATVSRARNMSQLARDAGVSREGLYKALGADGNPSFGLVTKVAQALGFRVTFAPITADAA